MSYTSWCVALASEIIYDLLVHWWCLTLEYKHQCNEQIGSGIVVFLMIRVMLVVRTYFIFLGTTLLTTHRDYSITTVLGGNFGTHNIETSYIVTQQKMDKHYQKKEENMDVCQFCYQNAHKSQRKTVSHKRQCA